MDFIARHCPKAFTDLVFLDPKVEDIVRQYTEGIHTRHLLLYGPAGSGKSEAARVIVNSCLGAGAALSDPIDRSELEDEGSGLIERTWNVHMTFGAARGYAIIDEIDFLKLASLRELRDFIDKRYKGTLVCTTNNLHLLDTPLRDRFRQVEVKRPLITNWVPRARAIMQAEGCNLTPAQLNVLLQGSDLSARDVMSRLEDALISLQASSAAVAKQVLPRNNILKIGSKQAQSHAVVEDPVNEGQDTPTLVPVDEK